MKNIEAKKKFGQNFLIDETYVNKIIQSMPHNNHHIVEIGPGLGDLTCKLVKYKDMTAYEIDVDMYNVLTSKFSQEIKDSKLDLVLTDVLEFWEQKKTLFDGKYNLIANLPYYVATNIIFRALDDTNCDSLIVMIQKEVAQKFVAKEGDKEFSALGVISSLHCTQRKILFDVPPIAFNPPPKVTSSVMMLQKKDNISLDIGFKKFLKVAFSQPRKKLIKNISNLADKEELALFYKDFDLLETLRPHELSPSLYHQLYNKVILNGRKQQD